jgi:hypothetical protein
MKLILYGFLSIVVASSLSCSKPPSEKIPQQVSLSYFDYIDKGDFEAAAALFCYPPNYTSQELAKDKGSVAKALGVVNREFGGVLTKKKVNALDGYLYLIIFGGDISYWDQHASYTVPLIYEVKFGNEGQGNVIVHLCKVKNEWEIQKVMYCLPSTRSDSKSRISEIMQKMIQTVLPTLPNAKNKEVNNSL